jgi:small GTP-binding protein
MRLLIWDLAGGEKFTGLHSSYLQGAGGAILVCDLTRSQTVDILQEYKERLQEISPQAKLIVVGNKVDLYEGDNVIDKINQISQAYNAPFFITSAKTGQGVEKSFKLLAENMADNMNSKE